MGGGLTAASSFPVYCIPANRKMNSPRIKLLYSDYTEYNEG